jgi:hypothetical protein
MRSRRVEAMLLSAVLAVPLAVVSDTIMAHVAGAASVPSAPRSVSAVPANHGATVIWKAPVSNGGSTITGYVVTPYLGTVAQPPRSFSSAKTAELVTGLTNGKAYSFKVVARNALGEGVPSAKSGATIAGAPGRPGSAGTYIPPPTLGQIGVDGGIPSKNGSNITRYNATCTSSNGGVTVSGVRENPAYHIVLLSGLTSGKTYKCTMTATNARGTGPRSNASSAFVAP